MSKVALDAPAPDFSLPDFRGTPVTLSKLTRHGNVLLVFNRGFT